MDRLLETDNVDDITDGCIDAIDGSMELISDEIFHSQFQTL